MSNYQCRNCGKIANEEPCQHCNGHDDLIYSLCLALDAMSAHFRAERPDAPVTKTINRLLDRAGYEGGGRQ